MNRRNERSSQSEVRALGQWLIRRAAVHAPDALSSRLEEEWLADLESRSSALPGLLFAMGCCWASLVIASEFSQDQVPAANPAPAAMGHTSPVEQDFSYLSLPPGTIFLIAGLLAALFYGLVAALSLTH